MVPSFKTLMTEFGKRLGIDDLEVEDEAGVSLCFDNIEVHIEEHEGYLCLCADVGEVPEANNLDLLTYFLEANYLSSMMDTGTLGIDSSIKQIVLSKTERLAHLEVDTLHNVIEKFVNQAEFWITLLQQKKGEIESEQQDSPPHHYA